VIARTFRRLATTKNTVRFAEEATGEPIAFQTLYVQKSVLQAAGLSDAEKLTLIVGAEEEFADG
jgi:hypothetical protein